MSKETFKEFIKTKPELAKAVLEGKTTYQKLYETFDLYGKDSSVFSSFAEKEIDQKKSSNALQEVTNMFRNIDLDTIQKGVIGLQKAVSLIEDIVPKGNNSSNNIPPYEERPINKYYED